MAELASAAPTSGGVSMIIHIRHMIGLNKTLAALFLDPLSFIPSLAQSSGVDSRLWVFCQQSADATLTSVLFADANTIGSVAAVASIDWGCAVQITAAASIGSNESFSATNAQTL